MEHCGNCQRPVSVSRNRKYWRGIISSLLIARQFEWHYYCFLIQKRTKSDKWVDAVVFLLYVHNVHRRPNEGYMIISPVSSVGYIPVSTKVQNTNDTFIPDNAETIFPVLTPVNADTLPAAVPAQVISAPIVPPIQNANAAVVQPAPEESIPPPTAVTTTGVSTIAAGDITPPIVSMSEVAAPDDPVTITPDTAQDIVPPLAAFNIIGGASMVIETAPKEDTSGVGDHGEVAEVLPPQPALNNVPGNSAQAKTMNSGKPFRGPSTGKRALDYLRTIRTRAQATDREFQRRHLPYRFKVLTDNNENVLIDLSILDGQGKVIKHETRNVTNDNFGALMDNISTGKGLLIDDLPQG
jgi:hypothetical protein